MGYGSDLIMDSEDEETLATKPDIERETILLERQGKLNKLLERYEIIKQIRIKENQPKVINNTH